MHAATYRSREEEKADFKLSSSPDGGVENSISEKQDAAGEYLENALGDVLGEVLADCAQSRPDDPVAFVADAFAKLVNIFMSVF